MWLRFVILVAVILALAAWKHGNGLLGNVLLDPANGDVLTDPANGNVLIR